MTQPRKHFVINRLYVIPIWHRNSPIHLQEMKTCSHKKLSMLFTMGQSRNNSNLYQLKNTLKNVVQYIHKRSYFANKMEALMCVTTGTYTLWTKSVTKGYILLDVVAHICSPSTLEAEEGGLLHIPGQFGLHSKTLSQKNRSTPKQRRLHTV